MALRLRTPCLFSILLSFVGAMGCSSSDTEPTLPPTLFVTNPLCDTSECRPIEIRAYIYWRDVYPPGQPPWGLRVLDVVPGPTACLSFPPSWELVGREVDSTGVVVDSIITTWTPDDGLYLTALDPAHFLTWYGATETFTPGEAEGWDLSFSPDPTYFYSALLPYSAHLSPGEKCTQF